MDDLEIVSILAWGKLPFKHNLRESEVENLIKRSKLFWEICNCKQTDSLNCQINNVKVRIFKTGSINLQGRIKKDLVHGYNIILKEFEKYCPRILSE